MNELLLILSMVFEFGLVLLAYRMFGKSGLYVMTAMCTIAANIEVMILVNAFGMEQTLGNILFAASFVITDVLSENEGKEAADKAVNLGIFVSIVFLIITQSWRLYTPADGDTVFTSICNVFSQTPRIMLSSLAVYAIVQRFDVWLYHKWWNYTNKKFGDPKRFLWLRNNASTLASQLLNILIFTFAAFWGTYDLTTLLKICASSYVIYIFTSLCDTPVVYLSRRIKKAQDAKAVQAPAN